MITFIFSKDIHFVHQLIANVFGRYSLHLLHIIDIYFNRSFGGGGRGEAKKKKMTFMVSFGKG
jgi:hypothetical protein